MEYTCLPALQGSILPYVNYWCTGQIGRAGAPSAPSSAASAYLHDIEVAWKLSRNLAKTVVICEIKLFQYFISHVTTSETEIKLFQPLDEF